MDRLTKKDGESLRIVDEKIEALKAILPDAFIDCGIDFDVLRQLLGGNVIDSEEKYGLTWHGKKKARQIALMPSAGTLRPCPEESIDWKTTQNLFIEGDNLEVLKLLQRSYAGKVKLVFIDPPYNTGQDFIYPDNYQDNLDTYLRYTGQKSLDGFRVSSNTEGSGRFHTNWLNMIYPRLKLAREMLSQDGSIWITIDGKELENLSNVMKEIFGDENFIGSFIWEKRLTRENRKVFSVNHDYILCATKSRLDFESVRGMLPLSDEAMDRYSNPDNDPRGPWQSVSLNAQSGHATKDQFYEFVTPGGRLVTLPPGRCWSVTERKLKELISDNRVWFGVDGNNVPREKLFLSESKNGLVPHTLWKAEEVGTTDSAKKGLIELLDGKDVFDTPKPVELMSRIVDIGVGGERGAIVLDFFAGSASIAHAILKRNAEGGSQSRFILVQLPEIVPESADAYKAGFKTISEIGKERIRRAARKVKAEHKDFEGDLGFKCFKLDSSNIRAWNPDASSLEKTLLDHAEHLVEGRSEQDVLYELLLKRGVDLSVPMEKRELAGKTVYSIGYGVLFACLDEAIDKAEIEALGQGITDWHKELEPAVDTQVVFRDSAFADDIAKTNMTAILEQNGIAHVRSL